MPVGPTSASRLLFGRADLDRRTATLAYEFLDHVSRRIVNEVAGIPRVVYDISGKPPATIEWD